MEDPLMNRKQRAELQGRGCNFSGQISLEEYNPSEIRTRNNFIQ